MSEKLPNFSRVTHAQLAVISFPSEGRYQPVRAVSSKTSVTANSSGKSPISALGLASQNYAGGGGILILSDLQPDEEAEFVEFETEAVAPPPTNAEPAQVGNGHAIHGTSTGPHVVFDENSPDSDPPESFEVCPCNFKYETCPD